MTKRAYRFSLRSLLLLVTAIACLLAACLFVGRSVDRWVKGEYKKVFDKLREEKRPENPAP